LGRSPSTWSYRAFPWKLPLKSPESYSKLPSLSNYLIRVFAIATVLIAVATFFMSRGTQTRYLESEVEDRYIQLTELLRVSAEDAVVAEDLTLLADLVADLGDGDHSIALLQITNDEGRVIAEWRTPRADGESVLILPPAVIELDGRSQGEIRLQVDLAYEYAIINAFVLRNASTIAILVIGLLIVQLVLINRRAIKPVLRIKERLKAVETGDLRTDFEAAGSREFAQLASSLNEVAETLNTRRISEKKARDELEQTLDHFARFVPSKFIENIGVQSPLDAKLGGHVETRKAVMFADLRDFTTISEHLEAGQIFDVINQYLACTVPCIEAQGGYVLQYLGDGIMALFPAGTSDALQAAIDMQKALRYCQEQHSSMPFRLQMSIGIHEGPVALGIVGNETRWDASIIADAVNASSRIEAMTRVLGGDIIVSQEYLDNAGDISGFSQRNLGVQQIRGRKGLLELVEILDSLDPEILEAREATSGDFAKGIEAYQNGDLYLAMSCFSRVLATVPDDLAAQFYLARISQRITAFN